MKKVIKKTTKLSKPTGTTVELPLSKTTSTLDKISKLELNVGEHLHASGETLQTVVDKLNEVINYINVN